MHRDGEQARVRRAGLADRERRDRNALRHLHDRVAANPRRAGTSTARARRAPAPSSSRRACPGRCAAPPAPAMMQRRPRGAGVLRVLEHVVGHPVRGQHARLVGDAEGVELRDRVAHDVPVAVAAHHDADQRCRSCVVPSAPPRCSDARRAAEPRVRPGSCANLSIRERRGGRARSASDHAIAGDDARACLAGARVADNADHASIPVASRSPLSRCACRRSPRRRAAPVRRRFPRRARRVRARRPRPARRARAEARRPRARAVRRVLAAASSRLDDARPTTRSRAYLDALAEHAARRPPARRLAEVARQARPLGDASRADYPPPPGDDVELACYGIQYRRQRDGDAALAAAKPLWFTGQAHARRLRAAVRRADRDAAT